MDFTKIYTYVLNRLKEPSTWAGIAVFVGMFGVSPETIDRITTNAPAIITAIGAIAAIALPSRKVATAVVVDPNKPTV